MERLVQFIGGGTGGHLMPALAVADALKRVRPEVQVEFAISGRETELRCFQGLDVKVSKLPTDGWNGSLVGKARFLARSPLAARRASRMYAECRPDVVVGLGGYASVVPVLVAQAKGIPTVLLESNVIPGRVTRLLSRFADEVHVQFPATLQRLRKGKGVVSGNPVRSRIFRAHDKRAYERFGLEAGKRTLLVIGGSQGARTLNRSMCESLPLLEETADWLQILHLTGPDDEAATRERYRQTAVRHAVAGFVSEMEDVYAITDVALSRAGGSTLAELTALGIPSILVPYPFAADRHQHLNAVELQKKGAAWRIDQEHLSPDVLAHSVCAILGNDELLGRMKRAARDMGRPEAARRVAERVLSLAGVATSIETVEEISSYPSQLAA